MTQPVGSLAQLVPDSLFCSSVADPVYSPRGIIDPVYSPGGIIDPVYSPRGIISPLFREGIVSPLFREGIISPSFAMEPSSAPAPFPGMSSSSSLRVRPSPIQQWEPLVYHRYDSYDPRPFFLPRSAVKPSTVTPKHPNLI